MRDKYQYSFYCTAIPLLYRRAEKIHNDGIYVRSHLIVSRRNVKA